MGDSFAGHLFCSVCEKFEERRCAAVEVSLLRMSAYSGLEPNCQKAQGAVVVGQGGTVALYIRRRLLDSILRAATLGPEYGVSAAVLDQQLSWRAYGRNILEVNLELSGRIIRPGRQAEPHLLIQVQQAFEIDLYLSAADQIRDSQINTCAHDPVRDGDIVVYAYSRAVNMWCEDSASLNFTSDEFTCGCCPTNIQVQVNRDSPQCAFAKVVVTCWRDLGPRGVNNTNIWEYQIGAISDFDFPRLPSQRVYLPEPYAFGTRSLKGLFESAGQ